MKYLFTNQRFNKSELLLYHEFNFLKKVIFMLIKEHYGYLIFFIKFYYLIGPNKLQLLFDVITNSIVA